MAGKQSAIMSNKLRRGGEWVRIWPLWREDGVGSAIAPTGMSRVPALLARSGVRR